ncbi:MAG: hypothetical protein WCJ58_00295 [bacterium]
MNITKQISYFKQLIFKMPLSCCIFLGIMIINAYSGTLYNFNHSETVITKFGIIFNQIDLSLLYRHFTMLLAVRDPAMLPGILLMVPFFFWYEYCLGSKKLLFTIMIYNIITILVEYLVLYQLFQLRNYQDIGLSNVGFGLMGIYLLIPQILRTYRQRVLGIGIIISFLISMLVTHNYPYLVAHGTGLICGLLLSHFIQKQNRN